MKAIISFEKAKRKMFAFCRLPTSLSVALQARLFKGRKKVEEKKSEAKLSVSTGGKSEATRFCLSEKRNVA